MVTKKLDLFQTSEVVSDPNDNYSFIFCWIKIQIKLWL